MATLAYFNLFNYPLKKREIYYFLQETCTSPEFESALDLLVNDSVVYRTGEFYCLQNDHSLSKKRIQGNEHARHLLLKAEKAARVISYFPYVRGVAVSGSLSKNYADETADIDFFIITAANRLWICRSFLHLFKKFTFLFNLQHCFCMNYFIDEEEMEIIEKNIFTATEIVTLLPLGGNDVFDEFYTLNNWTKRYLPNHHLRKTSASPVSQSWFKSVIEKLFNNRKGDALDNYLMKLTSKSWNKKTIMHKKNRKGIVMSLKASKHQSKPDPANFQFKLLKLYEHNLEEIYTRLEKPVSMTNEFR